MLTPAQKILTQDYFAKVIQRTLCKSYTQTSMKAHYLVFRNFDNHARLWSEIAHFIDRSLPTLHKFQYINALLIEDLVYYYLVPEFLQLSRIEVVEIHILHAISKISRERNIQYAVQSHFMDYTQIDIACPRHVCQLRDVENAIEELEYKVEAQRQGSEASEWRIVLEKGICELISIGKPICGYLLQTLSNFVDAFIVGNTSFRENEAILMAHEELRRSGVRTLNEYADVRSTIKEGQLTLEDLEKQIEVQTGVVERKTELASSLVSSEALSNVEAPHEREKRYYDLSSDKSEVESTSSAFEREKEEQRQNEDNEFANDNSSVSSTSEELIDAPVAESAVAKIEFAKPASDVEESQFAQHKKKILMASLEIDPEQEPLAPEAISTAIALAQRDKQDDLLITDDETESRKVLKPLRVTSESDSGDYTRSGAKGEACDIKKQRDAALPPATPIVVYGDNEQCQQSINSPSLIHGHAGGFATADVRETQEAEDSAP